MIPSPHAQQFIAAVSQAAKQHGITALACVLRDPVTGEALLIGSQDATTNADFRALVAAKFGVTGVDETEAVWPT